MSNDARKPVVVLDYNSTKGAVDTFDRLTSYYTCSRKTLRWPMRVFYFIVDAACLNASVLLPMRNHQWQDEVTKKHDSRWLYLLKLGEQLVMPVIRVVH